MSLNLELLGGGAEALRTGTAAIELRKAVAALTGVPGTTSTITSIVTNYSIVDTAQLQAISNSTANSTVKSSPAPLLPGSAETINATDSTLNAQFRRRAEAEALLHLLRRRVAASEQAPRLDVLPRGRALEAASPSTSPSTSLRNTSGCTPVNIYSGGTLVIPISAVELEIALPASYFMGINFADPKALDAAAALARQRLLAALANSSTTNSAFGKFVLTWANCTGLPPSTGVISRVANGAVIALYNPPPPAESAGGLSLAGIICIIIAVIVALGLIWCGVASSCPNSGLYCAFLRQGCCCTRAPAALSSKPRRLGAVPRVHHQPSTCNAGFPLRLLLSGSRPRVQTTPEGTVVHVCPHMTLTAVLRAALAEFNLDASDEAMREVVLLLGNRPFSLRDADAHSTLATLGVDATVAGGGGVLIPQSASIGSTRVLTEGGGAKSPQVGGTDVPTGSGRTLVVA